MEVCRHRSVCRQWSFSNATEVSMSAPERAMTRRHPAGNPWIAAYLAMPFVLALLAVGVASAELPSGVTRVSAADAERTGSAIHLARQLIRGATLVRVE